MRVLITDDEVLARERLRRLVEESGAAQVVGEAANGRETLLLCERLRPDVVLLDIRMPGMDGLEAAGHLAAAERPPAVVFTTAYSDHALAAFEAHAVDYLVKPIRRERLAEALRKARRLSRAQLRAAGGGVAPRTHICVRGRDGMRLIPVRDIIFLQADHKYVTIRHAGGEALIEESLTALEREFAERFQRIHRNTLVARELLEGIEKIGAGHYAARLRGADERPPISRRHLRAVKRLLTGGAGG